MYALNGNEDKTVTTLESGSVMIQKPTEEPITILSPNEQLEYHNTTGEFQKRKLMLPFIQDGPKES